MFTLLVLALIAALLALRHIVQWARFMMLAWKLPSPKTVPFIGNIEAMTTPLSGIEKILTKHFYEFPRFFTLWFGPVPITIVRDPRELEIILGGEMKNAKKSLLYKFVSSALGNGLGFSRAENCEERRKLLYPAFHTKILENILEVFERKSQLLVQKLEKELGQKSFDVNTYFSRVTIDALYGSLLEEDSNYLWKEEDNDFTMYMELMAKHLMRRIISPWYYPDVIYWNSSPGKQSKKITADMIEHVGEIINKKRQKLQLNNQSRKHAAEDELLGKRTRQTFLDILLESSENGVQLSDIEIIYETMFFIIAGFDTLRSTLDWSMQVLGTRPEMQDKIYEEIENILQGSDRSLTMKDLNDMKYLERVIKEVLRLYPPLPIISRVAITDLEMGGYTIPAGMLFGLSIYHAHRNPEIYPDPEKFDPDRFLRESESKRNFAYIPFSAGPRNCMGQRFSMLELKIMLSYIIRNYRIHATRDKVTPVMEILIGAEEGFYIAITKRNLKNAKM